MSVCRDLTLTLALCVCVCVDLYVCIHARTDMGCIMTFRSTSGSTCGGGPVRLHFELKISCCLVVFATTMSQLNMLMKSVVCWLWFWCERPSMCFYYSGLLCSHLVRFTGSVWYLKNGCGNSDPLCNVTTSPGWTAYQWGISVTLVWCGLCTS